MCILYVREVACTSYLEANKFRPVHINALMFVSWTLKHPCICTMSLDTGHLVTSSFIVVAIG